MKEYPDLSHVDPKEAMQAISTSSLSRAQNCLLPRLLPNLDHLRSRQAIATKAFLY